MKHSFFLLVLSLVIVSCDNSQKNYETATNQFNKEDYVGATKSLSLIKNAEGVFAKRVDSLKNAIVKEQICMSYDGMKKYRNDTTYLNFILGSTKQQVEIHISELLKQKKMGAEETFTFDMGFGEYKQKLALSGYVIDFYPNDYYCKGLIKLNYFLDKLSSVEITLFNSPDGKSILLDVQDMYKKKYGSTKKFSNFYNEKDSEHFSSFWRISNKAIYICEIGGFVSITYEDLIAKHEKDKLEKNLNEIDKENNTEESKKTQTEI